MERTDRLSVNFPQTSYGESQDLQQENGKSHISTRHHDLADEGDMLKIIHFIWRVELVPQKQGRGRMDLSKGLFGKGYLVSECQLHEIDVELFLEIEALLYRCKENLSS